MSRHDDRVALLHMRDHATEAVEFVWGRSRSDLDSDRLFALAMIKLVEIIGEAAAQVSPATRATFIRTSPGIRLWARAIVSFTATIKLI